MHHPLGGFASGSPVGREPGAEAAVMGVDTAMPWQPIHVEPLLPRSFFYLARPVASFCHVLFSRRVLVAL